MRVVQRVIALVVPAAFIALLVSFGARVYRRGRVRLCEAYRAA